MSYLPRGLATFATLALVTALALPAMASPTPRATKLPRTAVGRSLYGSQFYLPLGAATAEWRAAGHQRRGRAPYAMSARADAAAELIKAGKAALEIADAERGTPSGTQHYKMAERLFRRALADVNAGLSLANPFEPEPRYLTDVKRAAQAGVWASTRYSP